MFAKERETSILARHVDTEVSLVFGHGRLVVAVLAVATIGGAAMPLSRVRVGNAYPVHQRASRQCFCCVSFVRVLTAATIAALCVLNVGPDVQKDSPKTWSREEEKHNSMPVRNTNE